MATRTAGIALLFIAVATAIGFVIDLILSGMSGLFGLNGIVFFSLLFFLLSLLLSAAVHLYATGIIIRRYHAKSSEDKDLNGMVDRMAVNAKIPTPKVYIAPIDVPNAFATGRGDKASVCVTEGLLSLNTGEKESVVAHEIRHIANSDTLVQDFAVVLANILRYTVVLIPLAIAILKFSLSERREYHADYYGSRLSGKPADMASALGKMSETARQNPMSGSPAYESIWTIDPFKREGLARMFSTHPPTARRAKRLEDMIHEGMPEPPEATEFD